MKKMLMGLVCLLTAVVCAFGVLTVDLGVAKADESSVADLDISNIGSGIGFAQDTHYDVEKVLPELPRTMEAVFTINSGFEGRSGILLGNHRKTLGDESFNFELQWDNTKKIHYPKIYYINKECTDFNQQINFNFTSVALTAGTQYHLAIVHDTYNKKAYCYVDGALKQTIEKAGNDSDYSSYVGDSGEYLITMDRGFRVGGDYRNPGNATSDNNCYFKGKIKHISLYSDVRTATEITGDYRRKVYDYTYGSDLILAYDFTKPNPEFLKDLSGNGYDITYTGPQQYASVEEGFVFGVQEKYVAEEKLTTTPVTYEAEIYLPKSMSARAGVVIGNYEGGNTGCFSFEIYSNGVPRFYFDTNQTTATCDARFDKVDVRTGDWAHIAVVHDKANEKLSCYLDGEFIQALVFAPSKADADKYNGFNYELNYPAMVGGDWRSDNSQYFKGIIKNVTLYSDMRTETEIKADVDGVDVNDANMLVHYDFSDVEMKSDVADASKNGNDLIYQKLWIEPEDKWEVGDYEYTFAVVGDTQWMNYCYNDKMDGIYDWILDQKDDKNIQYVFGLGDVTEKDKDWEWATAKEVVSQLDGVIPYSIVRGNHDTCKGMTTFNYDAYLNQFDGFYSGEDICNSYRTIEIEGDKYLMITLDYGASDAVLAWAGELCETYSDHKVIVTTHAYMYRDGTTLDQKDVCPPATTGGYNNGDHMWDKFVSKYENIFLVMSGHDPCDDIVVRQEEGVHGNLVTQMLIDFQYTDRDIGGNGMVALLHINQTLGTIEVECYSTVREQYFKTTNQPVITTLVHEFDKEVATEEFLATPATCTKPATYYYSCEHGLKSAILTFSYGEPIAHTFDKEIVSDSYLATVATCSKKATYYYSCECGAKGEDTFESGEFNANSHEYDQKVTTDKYFRKPATCSVAATYYYSCVCGLRGTVYFENGEPSNVHNFNKEVVSDEYKASDASCSKKATYFYSCECGEAGEETFTDGDFTAHEYDKQVKEAQFLFKQASCESPAVYFYSCECGAKSTEKFNDGEAAGHKFDDQYTCHDRVCSECNKTVSATTSHEYGEGEVVKQPTTSSDGEKKFTCGCGATKTESIAKLESDGEGSSCSTVMPVGGNGTTPGGMALMIVSMLAVALVLNLKKRKSAK